MSAICVVNSFYILSGLSCLRFKKKGTPSPKLLRRRSEELFLLYGDLRAPVFPYQMLMKGDLIWLTVVSVSSCIGSNATFG